ncbi:unnamed protein product [Parnassius apollo]|uniref:(apollo) hypothetical protein n=1 Tax=Parnassius apollo TaxID=110799 RepID=A0A8S3W4I0_PARAO|nr:unnamed protein product [Parnassius apollo]
MEQDIQQILSILEESDSDDFFSDNDHADEEDHVSVCSQASDTNVPLSEVRMELQSSASSLQQVPETSLQREVRLQYLGKDGTVWFKTPSRRNVRTTAENIITQLPGVTREAKFATSELECWGLFFSDCILQKIMTYTNTRIRRKMASCKDLSKHAYMKECSMTELKAFTGLLYIAGLLRSGRQNLTDL